MKISLVGVSRAGKTCYISAMSQILKNCKLQNGCKVILRAVDVAQQLELDNNYMEMVTSGKWPKGTDSTKSYNFRIQIQGNGSMLQLPSLTMDDYKGGVLTLIGPKADVERKQFIDSLKETALITFLIDGDTVISALDELDKDVSHRGMEYAAKEKLASRNNISILDNILYSYLQNGNSIPPIMVVITKSDVFATEEELRNGMELVRDLLSSLFMPGSNVFAGITAVSLGTDLAKGEDDSILGMLDISTNHNVHIPMLFAIYAYLDATYDTYPDHDFVDGLMALMRNEFNGRSTFYDNGEETLPI